MTKLVSTVIAFAATFYVAVAKLREMRSNGSSDLCDPGVKSLSGYFEVDKPELNNNYFYWFFESRNTAQLPVEEQFFTIWLTGGPGCSSQLALLTENGPCKANSDGQSTYLNPYSWNENSNMMWVDQPAGVGYSYGTKTDRDEADVAEDMYDFLQAFFTAHPEYLKMKFFVFGESYGGHYAPAIAARVFEGNQKNEGLFINLHGVAVGNGLTDPVIQYQYYPSMAMNNTYDIKTVSEETYQKMVDHVPSCVKMAEACQDNVDACEAAYEYCNLFETTPYYNTGLNPYDIRVPCGEEQLCYDFSAEETFLNLNSTRSELGVSDEVKSWESCNTAVDIMFISDWMREYEQVLVPMIEGGVRVLIYAGDVDFICNWMGNKAWTLDLPWSGKEAFNAEEDKPWMYEKDGAAVEGGKARTALASAGGGSLTFLQVYEAGHMVPMDQPQAALSMVNTFFANKGFY